MLKPEQIAEEFATRAEVFFNDTYEQRAEAAVMQRFYDGHPTLGNNENVQWQKLNKNTNQPARTRKYANAPIAPAIIKHVVGMMAQSEKQFTAFNANSSLDPDANTMRQGLKYVDAQTHRESVKKEQIKQAAITGISGTVASLDFTQDDAPEGLPCYELKHDIMYDTGMRDCVDSDRISWCGYADPMKASALQEYIDSMEKRLDVPAVTNFRHYLLEHTDQNNTADIDFLYVYYWMEYRKVYDIENVFKRFNKEIVQAGEQWPEVYNLFGELSGLLQLDFQESHFILDGEARKQFYDALENITFITGGALKFEGLEESSRMGKAYYRAEFAKGLLLTASRSFTQSCHAMSFIACEYDKTYGYHYGLMRPLAFYQRMLNDSMDDMLLYSSRSASGGTALITGAGVDAADLKKYIDNKEQVFFASKDTSINNIGTPDAAQAHLQTAEIIMRMMPMSLGLNGNLFDTLLQVEKTAEEVRHIQTMMAASFATFQASLDKSTLCDSWIFRDMVYEMARNLANSKHITFTLGGKEDAVTLSRKNLSRHYTMRLIERKQTRDEELAEFDMFKDLILAVVQDPQALLRIAPALIERHPSDLDAKEALLELLTPKPDPAAEQEAMEMKQAQKEQILANNRMINAQAAQLEQQSGREQSASELNKQKAAVEIGKAQADIEHKQAQTVKTEADAAKVITEIGMTAYRGVDNMAGA